MAALDELFSMEMGGDGAAAGSFLSSLFLPPNLLFGPIPQLPTPVCTSDFPDPCTEDPPPGKQQYKPSGGRGRRKRVRPNTPDCCICLEPVLHHAAVLPCKHELHRNCLFSLVTYPVLGARSMVHCPMCRYALDRYDLRGMGCDVSVQRLVRTAQRCACLRQLANGSCATLAAGTAEPVSRIVAHMVQSCGDVTADDGFVYNTAVLALDRAIMHRHNFVTSLAAQLQCPRNASLDPMDFITRNLTCHLEVLMRTATAAAEEHT
jgi:hypothetical protein